MEFNLAPEKGPTFREWLIGNGYIFKECLRRLYRFNGGTALKLAQPHLKKVHWGPTPFEYEWDLLIVLDTCRPDALQMVASEYDWLPDNIDRTRSVSSWSKDWYRKSFTDKWADEKAETALVSWNPFTDDHIDNHSWFHVEEVWDGGWDDEHGLIRPRQVTDHAIAVSRNRDPDRMLVHYMQPHAPYRDIETERLSADEIGDVETERRTVWDRCIDPSDDLTADDAWDAMLNNLRWVLDDVELLLENIDANRVLLTADHGEMFGRLGVYGHGPGMPFPWLLWVPKVWLTATDTLSYQPNAKLEESAGVGNDELEERLVELGYR